MLLLAASFSLACARHNHPQSAFDHAQRTFQGGDLTGAIEEADGGCKKFGRSHGEWMWAFRILKARALSRQGMYEQALSQLAARGAPSDTNLAIQKLRVEAVAHAFLRRFPEAETEIREAEQLCVENQPACRDLSISRGTIEMEHGDYGDARTYFETGLSSAREASDQFAEASALLNLSWVADLQEHFDEALDRADAARRLAQLDGFAGTAETALGNMGWAYYRLGDSDKAGATFLEASRQAERLGNATDQSGWVLDAGYVYLDEHNFSAAEAAYKQSLALATKIKSREDVENAVEALAFVSEQTNKLDDASRYADQALGMARADGNKRDEVYPRLVQGRVAAKRHDAANAESAFREVERSPDAPVFLKWEAERDLARLYEDGNRAEDAGREYRTALNTFEAARAELQHESSRLPFLNNASHIYDDYIHFLVSRGKADEALRVADYSRARTLAEGLGLLKNDAGKNPKPGNRPIGAASDAASKDAAIAFAPYPLDARQVARRAGGTILFYWLGEKQSYLWAITQKETDVSTLPGEAEIRAAVQRYRKSLVVPQDVLGTAADDGAALYRMLVAPAQNVINKNSSGNDANVFIVPDGVLNSLNFETLIVSGPTPDPQFHYWIEDANIANASSLRLLGASRGANSNSGGGLLLIGDPSQASPDFPRLRNAPVEIEDIEKHFEAAQQKVLRGEGANPQAYLASQPEQFAVIHFVAHGTASRLSPLDSAIILSKATAEDDSYKLYARDIIQHPLRARLVTISTCSSAGERAYSGEGLVGLSWAFLRAGAHNVIGALWEASDDATPQIMDAFYGELQKGKSPSAALRIAKLGLLHSPTAAYHRPFYWAPFQLYTGS